MADDFEADSEGGGFLNRLRESPRTVSALIIILIIAAAIYAFSGDDDTTRTAEQEEPTQVTTTDGQVVTEDAIPVEAVEEGAEGETAGTMDTDSAPKPVTTAELDEEVAELPEPTRTAEGFSEVAEAGDGITHLARRATTRWLSENQTGYAVTNEHRIFIEDYVQNRTGSEGLALGETRTIAFDLIAEAVEAAGALNESQLKNLSQYTHALNS